MRVLVISALFLTGSVVAAAQSKTFRTLEQTFRRAPEVYSFSAPGFLARAVLRIAGENEFVNAVRDVRSVRLMVIPKNIAPHLSVGGFRKLAEDDAYELLASLREQKDNVMLYARNEASRDDAHYLAIIDDQEDVVVMEIHGSIDRAILQAAHPARGDNTQ